MIEKNAQFYFANLGSDVARCVAAALGGDSERYDTSLVRARATMSHLREIKSYTAFEEGLLLLRGLAFARKNGKLESFSDKLDALIMQTSASMLKS